MDSDTEIVSGNINSKWLSNIYENIVKLEQFERYAREGCADVMEYLQIPLSLRSKILADTQYKNLRLMYNELKLIIPDTKPVLDDDITDFKNNIEKIKKILDKRELFLKEIKNSNGEVINSYTTEFYDIVLELLAGLREDIISKLSPILYVKENKKETWR